MNDHRKPTNGRIIVEIVENEQTSKGGLVIVETFESPIQKTRIISVGKLKNKDSSIKPDNFAYISKHHGIDIGMGQLCVREDDILFTTDK
jgi:co-chaperonin GroES (HSP10)